MSEKLNHHFVPQFHFRIFTGGKRFVHLASRNGSRVVTNASIRHQCARHKFYGDKTVENWLTGFETRHATVYQAIVEMAKTESAVFLSAQQGLAIREAILLQRSRTPQQAQADSAASDAMLLHVLGYHLKTLPMTRARRAIIQAIQSGRAGIRDSMFASLISAIHLASRSVKAISDLSILILRNHTPVPFVMSDAPCVFSNHYMRSVDNYGVLGFLSPGLMAVLPINPRTQVLLYDAAVYKPSYSTGGYVDMIEIGDVSMLNALQVHSSEENIYFSDIAYQDYVRALIAAHRPNLRSHRGRFAELAPGKILIDGVPNSGRVLHLFEPQLPITLGLSFIATSSMPLNENPNRPRDPILAREIEQTLGLSDTPSAIGIQDFAGWVESQIVIRGND